MESNMRTIPISWEEIDQVVSSLAERIQQDGNPEIIVGIQRGGLIPSVILSHYLNVRYFLSFNINRTVNDDVNAEKTTPTLGRNIPFDEITHRDILLVDDIVGTGATIKVVKRLSHNYSTTTDSIPLSQKYLVLTPVPFRVCPTQKCKIISKKSLNSNSTRNLS